MVKGMTTIGIYDEAKARFLKGRLDHASDIGKPVSEDQYLTFLLDDHDKKEKQK